MGNKIGFKKEINVLMFFSVLLFFCTNCDRKSNHINSVVYSIDTTKLSDLILETYMIDPAKSAIIKCKKGTIIYYFANSLTNSKEELIKDSVCLNVSECYEPTDFIEHNITTKFIKRSLQTFGAIFIDFNQNGEELKLKKDGAVQIAYPKKQKAKNVKLYQGINKDGHITWSKELNAKKIDWFKYQSEAGDPTDSLNYYVFTSNVTSWLNCDQLLKNDANTTITIDLDTMQSANIHLLYPSLKVIEYPSVINNKIIFENAPINKPAILFGYTKIGNDYYMYYEELNVTQNQNIKPVFIKTTKEEIMKKSDKIKWSSNPEV